MRPSSLKMSLADSIAIGAAAGAFVFGFVGFVPAADGLREWIDNGQRGAFLGAYVGSIVAATVHFSG